MRDHSLPVCFFYFCIGAGLAELASAIPSSASGRFAQRKCSRNYNTFTDIGDSLPLGLCYGRASIWSRLQLLRRLVRTANLVQPSSLPIVLIPFSHRWNCLAWIFGVASVSLFGANAIVACWSVRHADYAPERWHIFIAYLFITWMTCGVVLFGHRAIAKITTIGGTFCLLSWFVTGRSKPPRAHSPSC